MKKKCFTLSNVQTTVLIIYTCQLHGRTHNTFVGKMTSNIHSASRVPRTKTKNKKEEGIKGKSVVKTSSVKYNLKKLSSYIKQNNKHENGNDKRINH